MLRSIWRGALGAAFWLAVGGVAVAQTGPANQVDQYKGPSGAYIPAQGVQNVGYDLVTGAPCIVGKSATCTLPAPSSPSYLLLTNASSTGPAVSVAGGNYGLDLGGTFGGSTVSIAYTLPNQSPVSLGSFTSATNSKTTCLVIPAGATVQATITGGSPSGLYAQLGGVGSCGGGGGGSVTVTGPLGSLAPSAGIAATLDTADAAALQSILSNVAAPIPAGTNAIGSITNAGFGVTTSVSGGATPFHVLSAASNNATLVSTGAHTLYSLVIAGTNTSVGDVRIYDSSASPTCSSATGVVLNFPVITTSGAMGGLVVPIPAQGIALANGLSYCITGAVADNDNTNAPTGITVNGAYK